MTSTRIALLCAVALAGCTTQNQFSYLVITKVVEGTFTAASGSTPSSCSVDPASKAVDFLHVNPAESSGIAAPVIENRLLNNANAAGGRLNSNDFVAHQAVIDYEVIGQPPLQRQIVPVDGVVLAGATGVINVPFFPPASNAPRTNGQAVRVTFHIEGKTTDGATAKTNQHEYIFILCNVAGGTSPCL
jgi:hypothetical protein